MIVFIIGMFVMLFIVVVVVVVVVVFVYCEGCGLLMLEGE